MDGRGLDSAGRLLADPSAGRARAAPCLSVRAAGRHFRRRLPRSDRRAGSSSHRVPICARQDRRGSTMTENTAQTPVESTAKLAAALAKVQATLPTIERDRTVEV